MVGDHGFTKYCDRDIRMDAFASRIRSARKSFALIEHMPCPVRAQFAMARVWVGALPLVTNAWKLW